MGQQSPIPKSAKRFSDKMMGQQSPIPKSAKRLSDKMMGQQSPIPKSAKRLSDKMMALSNYGFLGRGGVSIGGSDLI